LRERSAGEPQAGLPGAGPHVAQFLGRGVETPDRPDARGHLAAEQRADNVIQALIAGRQHDEVRPQRRAVAQRQSVADEMPDIGRLHQPDFSVRDQVGAADIEIISAAAGAELQGPAGAVLAELATFRERVRSGNGIEFRAG